MIGITKDELSQARKHNLTLQPVKFYKGNITAIKVKITGYRGGQSLVTKFTKYNYELYIDVKSIHYSLPLVYIVTPRFSLINHANVFPPILCKDLDKKLPYLCWGENKNVWMNNSSKLKNLKQLLHIVKAILNKENPYSIANRLNYYNIPRR